MTTNTERIYSEVMALEPEERAELVDRLLITAEPSTDPEYVAAWEAEIDKRLKEVDAGTTKIVSWDQTFEAMRKGASGGGEAE